MFKAMNVVMSSMLALSLGLAGCGARQATTDEPNAPAQEEAQQDGAPSGELAGGWTASEETAPSVSEEERAVFEKAVTGLAGMGYEPVALLGTQVVAGTNYLFLCRTTSVTESSQDGWAIVTVYEDLEGNAEVTAAHDLDLSSPAVADGSAEEALVGGWTVTEPVESVALPEDAAGAFDDAMAQYVGVGYRPYALLGTQVVAGTNYLYLCEGETVTAEPSQGLYLVTVYQDLDGNAEVTDASRLDLAAYATSEE